MRLRSRLRLKIDGKDVIASDPISPDYIGLLQALLVGNLSSPYLSSFQLPSGFALVFSLGGIIEATVPVSKIVYNEYGETEQEIEYSAIDESPNSYQFDEIQLYAVDSNNNLLYPVAYFNLSQSIQKSQSSFIEVDWSIIVDATEPDVLNIIYQNTLFMYDGITGINQKVLRPFIPNNVLPCVNLGNIAIPNMPLPNFIAILTLLPASNYPSSGLFYSTLQQLPTNIVFKGITIFVFQQTSNQAYIEALAGRPSITPSPPPVCSQLLTQLQGVQEGSCYIIGLQGQGEIPVLFVIFYNISGVNMFYAINYTTLPVQQLQYYTGCYNVQVGEG